MELSRRDVLKLGVLSSAALLIPMERVARTKEATFTRLAPSALPDLKYKAPLYVVPPAVKTPSGIPNVDFYEMTMRLAWPHNLEGPALDEFAATMPGIPREQLKQGLLEGVGALVKAQGLGRKPAERVVADARRHFAALDAWLDGRDWLVGGHLTVADLATCAQVSALLYAQEVREIARGAPNVRPWLARVDAAAPDR